MVAVIERTLLMVTPSSHEDEVRSGAAGALVVHPCLDPLAVAARRDHVLEPRQPRLHAVARAPVTQVRPRRLALARHADVRTCQQIFLNNDNIFVFPLPTSDETLGVLVEFAGLHGLLDPEDDAVLVRVPLLAVPRLQVLPHVVAVRLRHLVVDCAELARENHRGLWKVEPSQVSWRLIIGGGKKYVLSLSHSRPQAPSYPQLPLRADEVLCFLPSSLRASILGMVAAMSGQATWQTLDQSEVSIVVT